MKKSHFTRMMSIILALILVITIIPISASAETISNEETDTKTKIESIIDSYNPNLTYTNNVTMGSIRVPSAYYSNLIYSSANTSSGKYTISTTVDSQMRCPQVLVSVYDGIDTPKFPVSCFLNIMQTSLPVSAIVLNDENALYETAGPYDYLGCSNVWTGANCYRIWITPQIESTIFNLMSKTKDFPSRLRWTRGGSGDYYITVSNALKVRSDYIKYYFDNSNKGYYQSNYSDTKFNFCLSSADSTSMFDNPMYLGENAVQYIIDYSKFRETALEAKNRYYKIREQESAYDQDKLNSYYSALLNLITFDLTKEFNTVNDDNAGELVSAASDKTATLLEEYNKANDELGEAELDIDAIKQFVISNYQGASIQMPEAKIKFNGTNVNDITFNNTRYNFGKNLVYCSNDTISSSAIMYNNVSTWITLPATVVMLYDGESESSFPIKVGYGLAAQSSEYTGSIIHSIYLGGESSSDTGSTSKLFSLGNYYWPASNATSPSVNVNDWFSSTSQLNSSINSQNHYGTPMELSKQYGGFYNKVVLDNQKFYNIQNSNPLNGTKITLYYRYANAGYDTHPHNPSGNCFQYVLNVLPLKEALAKMKEDYQEKIVANGEDAYSPESISNYYIAMKKLIDFDYNDYFRSCGNNTAYYKIVECESDMADLIAEYNEAYSNLQKQYKVTFVSYDGNVVSSQYYNEGDKPTAPENTPFRKASKNSKSHYRFYWPTIYTVNNEMTYTERRTAVTCTNDEGVVILEPTCTQTGTILYTCSVCNGTIEEEIEATGVHDYTKYTSKYSNGSDYKTDGSLTHDIRCSSAGEIIANEACSFKEVTNGTATIIYECSKCGGLARYTKKQYTIEFVDINKNSTFVDLYEDEQINPPELPDGYFAEDGHHSYSWDKVIPQYPTNHETFKVVESITPHTYSHYTYNDDATKQDRYGTETAKCDAQGCPSTDTKACDEMHMLTPDTMDVNGQICIAIDITGATSEIPLANATITVEGTQISVTTSENGEYTIPELEAGEYTIIISSATSIDRTVTLIVDADNATDFDQINIDPIGLIAYDYNKDGKINTIDASLYTKHSDIVLNTEIFKSLFNKKTKYDTLIVK